MSLVVPKKRGWHNKGQRIIELRKKTHIPTSETRCQVRLMIAHGLTEESIGRVLGVSDRTIQRHYKPEIAIGAAEAEAKVKRTAFQLAVGRRNKADTGWNEQPNVAMCIFLLKVRYGYKERAELDINDTRRHSTQSLAAEINALLDQIATDKAALAVEKAAPDARKVA